MAEALYARTARELRDLVRSREVTASEVAQSFLGRIDAVDGRVGAYVDLWRDHALEQAGRIDAQIAKGEDPGPLAGVPIGLKDNLCTSYGTTTCASKILAGFESPYDATIVSRLREAGAVFLGKLNMDEFAMGSSTENSSIKRTCNPWDLGRVPGGSSGGAAAGVTVCEAALTIGSDTGGSIRQPAAFCGCLGFKPTYGRVSRYGLVAFASSLDQIGPFARNTEDLALAMNAICGHDPLDATSADLPVPDYTQSLTEDLHGLTIGLPNEFYTGALNEAMREKVLGAVDVLRGLGAKTVDVSLPHTDYGIAVYYIIAPAEASANLARFDGVRYGHRSRAATTVDEMYKLTRTEGFGPEVKRRIMLGTYALSSGYYDAYYLKAQKVRALIRRDFDEAFAKCDVIATPTTPTPAFAFGEKTDDPLQMYLNDVYTNSVNLAGVPGLSVPCGLIDGKLPAGLQLIGRPFAEDTLIRVSYAYEKNRGFDPGSPPLN
jgi:aspartyl-tRNA(Asn)/glutamyl-tRNA(Gln) amidotransferase subunit A